MNAKAIETLAVNAVRDSVVLSDYLDQFIPDNDKEPSWDGAVYIYGNKSKRKDTLIGAGIRAGVNSPPKLHRPAMPGGFLLEPQALLESIVYIARRGRFLPQKQAQASKNKVFLQPQQVLRGAISNITKFAAFGGFGE